MKEAHVALYKEIVTSLAKCSSDKRLKVGCLVLKDGRIVSTGYNGQLPGAPHEPLISEGHDISTIHAEMNAVMFAARQGIALKDCDLFVSHFPCQNCYKHLAAIGIKNIYYVEDYRNEDNEFMKLGLGLTQVRKV